MKQSEDAIELLAQKFRWLRLPGMANIVGEVVSNAGMTMFRTAETEKYAHVTYFFNGGHEPPYRGEERQLVPSQKVATYDLAPEMSAGPITDALVAAIEGGGYDFIVANYANADMVGHSGSVPAILKAVETVDRSLARVLASAERVGARLLVTADHGNIEEMRDAAGNPQTKHTTSPVPLLLVDTSRASARLRDGALSDVAPTLCALMGIPPGPEMTGTNLLEGG